MTDKAFPGFVMRTRLPRRKAVLFQMAQACWSEYVACRLSATWAPDEQTCWFENTFCTSLEGVRARGNAAIRNYRTERDIGKLLNCITGEYGTAMKYASYLFGHVAGLEQDLNDAAPRALESIKSNDLTDMFSRLKNCLDELWKNYDTWASPEVFAPLELLSEEMLNIAGLCLETRPEGLYVDVPFTADTLPNIY